MIFYKGNSENLDIVLQGGSYGIDSPFMQKVINACKEKGNSVLSFNFPYFERGEENSSGPELKEEIQTIKDMMEKHNAFDYKNIRFVAKSLGAIVASYFLKDLSPEDQDKYSIVVLGYVTGSINLSNFQGTIDIVQGEFDKFGNIDVVKDDLKNAISDKISYFEVKGGDHSYRNPETKEPLFEDEAIKFI